MNRRIVLVLVVVAIVLAGAFGLWQLHHWQNRGPKLLERIAMAVHNKEYDRAIELSNKYLANQPKEPWKAWYQIGLCYTQKDRFDEAIDALEKAVKERPNETRVIVALAKAHSTRAARTLGMQSTSDQPAALREAIGQLQKAIEILSPALDKVVARIAEKPEAVAEAVELGYTLGDVQSLLGGAEQVLSQRLAKEAETAAIGGATDVVKTKRREAEEARAAADKVSREAIETLMAAVRRDPTQSPLDEMLIRLCLVRKDTASLEAVRQIIMALPDPPPAPATTLIMYEIVARRASGAELRSQLLKAAAALDAILKKHPDESRTRVARAQVALELGDVDMADQLLGEVLKKDPRNKEARLGRARSLMSRGQAAAAEAELFPLRTEYPVVDVFVLSAKAATAMGKDEAARDAMRTVTKLDPGNIEARRFLAAALLAKGFSDQAASDVQMLYETQPDSADALRLYVEWAIQTQQQGLAAQAIEKATQNYGTQPLMMRAIAEGLEALGQRSESQAMRKRLADVQPTSTEDRLAVAWALLGLGRGAEAEGLLNAAVAADPESAVVRFEMGQFYATTGRTMQAIEQYRMAVEKEPLATNYRVALAQALLQCGLLGESETECRAVLQQDPSNTGAILLANQIKIVRGEPVDIAAVMEQANDGSRVGLPLAMVYLRNGQPQEAIETCQTELRKSPENPDVHAVLGQAYLMLGNREKCLEHWMPLVANRPTDLVAYVRIASVLSVDQKPEAVESALGKLAGAKPAMVDMAMGWLYKQMGRYDVAAAAYERLLSRSDVPPDLVGRARLLYAEALAHNGRAAQALAELDELASVKAWYGYAAYAKAQLLASMGRMSEAEAVLAVLTQMAMERQDLDLIGRIAEIYVRLRETDNAIRLCDVLQQKLPLDARSYLLRAGVLAKAGHLAETIPVYRKAIELQPSNMETYTMLATVQDTLLDPKAAMATLQQMAKIGEAAQAVSLFEQGKLFMRWGLSHKAVECFESLGKVGYANDPRVKWALGTAYMKLGMKDRSRALMNEIPRYAVQYVQAQQVLASLAEKPEEKLAILSKLDAAGLGQSGVLAQQMLILLGEDRPAEAAALLAPYLERSPDVAALSSAAVETAFVAMVRAGNVQDAIEWIRRVAKVSPNPRWNRLATLASLWKEPGEAKVYPVDSDEAGSEDAMVGLIVSLRSGAGIEMWRQRLKALTDEAAKTGRRPPLSETSALLVSLARGRVEEAEAQLQTYARTGDVGREAAAELVGAVKANPAVAAEAVSLLGATTAMDMGATALGRAWAMDLLKARPASQWAASIVLRRDLGEAPDLEQQALEVLTPKNCVVALTCEARKLARDKKYEEAAEAYRRMAEAHPNDLDLMQDQAVAMEMAEKPKEALALYRTVWEKTRSPVAANNAAYLTLVLSPDDKGALTEAEPWTAVAVAAQPDLPNFLDTRGWILHLLGRDKEACPILRQAVKGLPESIDVHYHLGMVEVAVGNADLGRWHLQEVIEIGDHKKESGKPVDPAMAKLIAEADAALAKLGPAAP